MKRSLIAFQALLASSAVLCQTAEASSTYTAPEQFRRLMADEQLQPPVGTGRMFGPFQQVPGKSISQVNFRIGAYKDPQATGFSYRISVQGCH